MYKTIVASRSAKLKIIYFHSGGQTVTTMTGAEALIEGTATKKSQFKVIVRSLQEITYR